MSEDYSEEIRAVLLEELMQRVEQERYPSATMLNMIEELLTPDEVPRYADMLLRHIQSDRFPSIPLIARLKKLN